MADAGVLVFYRIIHGLYTDASLSNGRERRLNNYATVLAN